MIGILAGPMTPQIKGLIGKYVQELREANAAVFVGAGLSKAAGYVDWVGLLAPIAEELGLDANKESSELVKVAQFHINANSGNRSRETVKSNGVCSKQGITSPPGNTAYNASKAAVKTLSEGLAHTLRNLPGCEISAIS